MVFLFGVYMKYTGTLRCITCDPCIAAFFKVTNPTEQTNTCEFEIHNDYDYDHRSVFDYITITKIGDMEINQPYKVSTQQVSTDTYASADEGKQIIKLVLGIDRFVITDVTKA